MAIPQRPRRIPRPQVTAPRDRQAERGVIWNDPDLLIPWPSRRRRRSCRDKDRILPRLAECGEWHTRDDGTDPGHWRHRQQTRGVAGGGGAVARVGGGGASGLRGWISTGLSVRETFAASAPWLVVNAAAYTAVDAAEDDAAAAFRVNRDGPRKLARAVREAAAFRSLTCRPTTKGSTGLRVRRMWRPTRSHRRAFTARARACRREQAVLAQVLARDPVRDVVARDLPTGTTSCARRSPPGSAIGICVSADQCGCPTMCAGSGAGHSWASPCG